MATSKFYLYRDIQGYNGFGLAQSSLNYSTTLAVGVAQSITLPSDFSNYLVIFSFEPGANVWVAPGVTAAVPGGAFATTASVLNPSARSYAKATVLSFITPDATAEVGVSIYAL